MCNRHCLFVCLSVSNFAQKPERICTTFARKISNGPVNKWLNFGGDPDHLLDTGIVFRIRHCWEIRKMVNGHSFVLIRQMAARVRRGLAEICNVQHALSLCFWFSLQWNVQSSVWPSECRQVRDGVCSCWTRTPPLLCWEARLLKILPDTWIRGYCPRRCAIVRPTSRLRPLSLWCCKYRHAQRNDLLIRRRLS